MPDRRAHPSPAGRAARFALLGASIVVGALIAELGARLLLPAPQRVRIEAVDHEARREAERADGVVARVPRHPEEAGGRLYVDTPTGRRLRADARVIIDDHALSRRRVEIRTNALGYRNRPIADKAGTRILFLGDSITFGDYVSEPETFVRRVETLARRDGRDWETINAGVGGVGLDHEIAILLETGLATEPDVVVLDFYLNDFEASPGIRVVELPSPLDRSVLLHHAAHALARGAAALRVRLGGPAADTIDLDAWRRAVEADWPPGDAESDAMRARALAAVHDWGGAFGAPAWARIGPRLDELAALARTAGFRLVVVGFPVREQVVARGLYDAPQRALARALAAQDVPFLDLLPVLREAHAKARAEAGAGGRGAAPLFYDHCHPTPLGNEIVAEAIYRFLVSLGPGDAAAAGAAPR